MILFKQQAYYIENENPVISKCKVKVRTAREMLDGIEILQKNQNKYESPFLMIIPEVDKLCKPSGMLKFYKVAQSKDKEVIYMKNTWHAIYLEDEIKEMFPLVEDYITKRLK